MPQDFEPEDTLVRWEIGTSDLEATKALLDRLGVQYEEEAPDPAVGPRRDEATVLTIQAEGSSGPIPVIGYSGFENEIAFRADGSFVFWGIWE